MSTLKIAPGLRLDADYVGGGTLALLAKKGAGKSYTARVLAEEMWKAHVPFVLIDPMGTSWGLRAAADGSEGGLPIPIFGGDHADAPLERTGGALMADLVIEEGVSMILDLSALGTRAAERQFAHDFFDRLYRRNRELVHLLVDEADLFAPQKPQPGDAPLLGVTENIVRRGRNRGIGITLITQRPAVLNKDVLTQVDGLVAMRIVGKQDRDAIDDWVRGHADQDAAAEVKGSLASLENGECWWWIPELGILQRVQVRRSETFDSSPTKRAGESRREPKSLAEIDMGAIAQKMEATIERAKADDPKELRKQIAELRRELENTVRITGEPETITETVEVPVPVFNGEPERIERLVATMVETMEKHAAQIALGVEDMARRVSEAKGAAVATEAPPRATPRPEPAPRQPRAQSRPARTAATPANADGEFVPSTPQQKLLNAIAWLNAVGLEGERSRVGFVAGYSPRSSTFANYVSSLNVAGATVTSAGILTLTELGRELAEEPDVVPTSEAIQSAVLSKLTGPQRSLLEPLIAIYPDSYTREELAAESGYSATSSTFANYLSSLNKLGLIAKPSQGSVAAADLLFLS